MASNTNPGTELAVGHGDVATLKSAFDGWRETYEKNGGSPELLRLAMGYSKALSSEYTRAHARMEFNLLNGALSFKTAGLKDGGYDLWFVDDGANPGNTVRPDPQDTLLKVGTVSVKAGKGDLQTRLTREQLAGFTMESVVLTQAGKTPVENVVITGSPDLMTKLYYSSQLWPIASLSDAPAANQKVATSFEGLLPKVAMADTLSDLTPVLGAQVALGRQIFHNETFNGNGRNCGTCHRAENNFTIDPNFIAKLPPSDKLFVAETDPNLAGLENPTLMRKYGLILTNVDGADPDTHEIRPEIFRSVPHTLALATTIVSESTTPVSPFVTGDFEADNALMGATGWSGDGAPGTGTLRDFATGAVTQHFPKTLNRCPEGVNLNDRPDCQGQPADFRLPTEAELDAIEAYSLSLGRSKDYPVYKLTFLDPLTQAGKVLFDTKENPCVSGSAQTGGPSPAPTCDGTPVSPSNVALGKTANCNGCHTHAGARSSTTFANPTRNTGVEDFKINPARLVVPTMAYDHGFGTETSFCGPNGDTCYGDGRFNTAPLIEAADTPPYFHNNSVSTLEEAIASYNSDAFNQSPGALTAKARDRRVKLDSTQVTAVASFLRAINAWENIRMSNSLDTQAKQIANNSTARDIAKLGLEENLDAIQVLKDGNVLGGYAEAISKLESANYYQNLALKAPGQTLRNTLLDQALTKKREARGLIATCNESATKPSSVVLSPAGFTYTCAELAAF